MRFAAISLAVLFLAGAAQAAPGEGRPYDGHLPDAAPEHVAVVQVLDGLSGRPIEGVSVRCYLEWAGTGFVRAELLGQTATDAFGLASIARALPAGDAHWVFDRAGYAVHEAYGSFPPDRVWLLPGREAVARLVDPFGRPAAGVEVNMILGCGHSPAVRTVRTNAEGVFRFRDVDPGAGRAWIRMAGAMADYFDVPAQGGVLTTDPGTSIRGTVVDGEGEPVADVVVASLQRQRGPTALSDGTGRFRLASLEPEGEVWFFHESWRGGDQPFLVLTDVDLPAIPGARPPLRIVLPPATVEDEDEYRSFLDPAAFPVPIRVLHATSGNEMPDVSLILLSQRTGLGTIDEEELDDAYDPTGRRVIRVGPGRYVAASASPFEPYRIDLPTPVEISVEQTQPITANAVAQPILAFEGVTAAMGDWDFHLVLTYASLSVDPFEEDEKVHLPPDDAATVRVWNGASVRWFPVEAARGGVRKVAIGEIPSPEPVEEDECGPSNGVGELRLLDASGEPIAGRAARIERRNYASWGRTDEDGWFGSIGQSASGPGFFSLPATSVAPPFVLEVEGYVTRVVTVETSGNVTLRYPAGEIELSVVDADGTPLDFGWCVDGMTGEGHGGRLMLGGVEAGRRKVVVGAAGYRSQLFVVDAPEEGVRVVRAVLRP